MLKTDSKAWAEHAGKTASNNRDTEPTAQNLFNEIKADLFRYAAAYRFRDFLWAYFRVPGFKYSVWLRITHWSWKRGRLETAPFYMAARLVLGHLSHKFGYQICHKTSIGPGLHLGHFGSIIVNGKASIGNNANLSVGVIIGRTNRGRHEGVPHIGTNVWIGSHAILVGRINIGDNALIAPGAYVNFDVPAEAVVIGNPGKIVSMRSSEGYVNNKWPSEADSPE